MLNSRLSIVGAGFIPARNISHMKMGGDKPHPYVKIILRITSILLLLQLILQHLQHPIRQNVFHTAARQIMLIFAICTNQFRIGGSV